MSPTSSRGIVLVKGFKRRELSIDGILLGRSNRIYGIGDAGLQDPTIWRESDA